MQSAIRKDNKGRKLWTGESQEKDGRYKYRYIDSTGERKTIYSWKLTDADSVPRGKHSDISLREKEKKIQRDIDDDIVPDGGKITVLNLVEKYVSQKQGVKHNTLANYNFVINIIKKEDFGKKRIDRVKLSDAKAWLIKLQKDGRGYSSIHSIRGVIRPAFQMAVDDDLIRKNPFEFMLATVVVNDSVTREAITREQERAFLKFIESDNHFKKYYEGIYILFKTGMRISEFCGLTKSDIDFENRKIRVNHQLQRKRNMEYIIEDTKTSNGVRYIPMTADVENCFKKIIANRVIPKLEPTICDKNGNLYCEFLYLDKNNMPMVALHWEKYFKHIREKYNSIYKKELPPVTPHVARHTFCSNMAKSGVNPKKLQYIMGHADIGVTLNTYTHLQFEDLDEVMESVCTK